MNQNTSEEQSILDDFLNDAVIARGWAIIGIHRAYPDGGWEPPEFKVRKNQALATGLNELALGAVNSRGLYNWIAVGTQTAAASLGSVWNSEVSRKVGATITTSKMTMILVSTWGGAADSVISLQLETAALCNNVNSGSGIPLNIVTGVAATLANSDLLSLQMNFQIGSHNL